MTERNLDNLLDNISTAILLLDHNVVIRFANLSAEALFEHSRNQLVGHPLNEFLISQCIELSKFKHALIHNENFAESEIQLVFNDGRHCLASLVASVYEEENGPLLALEITPIEQQKKINEEN